MNRYSDITNKPEYIVIHHSATTDSVNDDSYAFYNYHTKERNFIDVGYHWIIEKIDGVAQVRQGRPMYASGAHTKEEGMNYKSIGICVAGYYDNYGLAEDKFELLVKLIRFIFSIYGELPIKKHSDYANKTCPGTKFPFTRLLEALELDTEDAPKSKYEIIGSSHIITTSPNNIQIVKLNDTLQGANVYGMNGGLFDMKTYVSYHIAINEGKLLTWNKIWRGFPRGIICHYYDGRTVVKRVSEISHEEANKIKWGISGGMLLPDYDPKIEGWLELGQTGVIRKANHSVIGHDKDGNVMLLTWDNDTMERLATRCKEIGMIAGVFVDGGGSTQLRHKDGTFTSTRKINTAILLKEV